MANDLMKSDFMLTARDAGQLSSDRNCVDFMVTEGDLALVSGHKNLVQAILNRLYSYLGELKDKPDYGSRLYQLIGGVNDRQAQLKAALYIRESLAAESRIKEVGDITIEKNEAGGANLLQLRVIIVPQGDEVALEIALPLNLEG